MKALKFVQLKGSGAQKRRRDGTCDAHGVEASHLRDRLMNKVPGLREFLITKRLRGGESIEVAAQAQMHVTQAQELFMLPNKSRNRSARYHSAIPARVPPKSNRESKESEDFQVTAAQVQHGREFAFDPEFEQHIIRASVDGMSKLKFGILAVSRHHQIRRRFLEGDCPNYLDHDFPYPGYLVAPFGIMFMARPGSLLAAQLDEILHSFQAEKDLEFDQNCHALVKGQLLLMQETARSAELTTSSKEELAKSIQLQLVASSQHRCSYPAESNEPGGEGQKSELEGAEAEVDDSQQTLGRQPSELTQGLVVGDKIRLKSDLVEVAAVAYMTAQHTIARAGSVALVTGVEHEEGATFISARSTGWFVDKNFRCLNCQVNRIPTTSQSGAACTAAAQGLGKPTSPTLGQFGPLAQGLTRDEHGRVHIAAPRSGPSHISLRACKFHENTAANNAELEYELYNRIITATGRSVFRTTRGNGPDADLRSVLGFGL